MYNAHFGFDVEPFRVNPDPRFLYLSESHREALASLIYTVQERKGFMVLTGEVGTGKTTLLNAMLRKLHPGVQTAYLFNTALTVPDFFAYLFDELELESAPLEPFHKSAVLHRLNEYLIDRLKQGLQTLLVVDEAQNLSAELLEEIRMLSNLETPQSKLLQIMLVGQPELAAKLRRPGLRQLRQRVELWAQLRPLSRIETGAYVQERMMIAGHEDGGVFNRKALSSVHRHSGGIPRIVNVLCDNSLLTAFARRSVSVSAQMVRESAHELSLGDCEPVGRERAREPRVAKDGWLRRIWSRRSPSAGLA